MNERTQPIPAAIEGAPSRVRHKQRGWVAPLAWGLGLALCFGVGTGLAWTESGPHPGVPVETAQHEVAAASLTRARIYRSSNAYVVAIGEAERCVRLDPSNAECHRLLGEVHEKLDHRQDSALEYRKFMDLVGPRHPDYEQVSLTVFGLEHRL